MGDTTQAKLKPFISKIWWKKSNQRTMATLSKLSKAFLLPIALLPIAGIFLGVGSTICSKVDVNTASWFFGNFLNQMGNIAFGNLPVLFAISVAIAYTEDNGVAAITAVIGFLVFNVIQFAFLKPEFSHYQYTVEIWGKNAISGADIKLYTGLAVNANSTTDPLLFDTHKLFDWMKTSEIYKALVEKADHLVITGTSLTTDSFQLLFYTGETWAVKNKLTTFNLGINSLNTGVFGGIFVGAIAAWVFNKFHKTQLPSAISFFSGSKLVPIIMFIFVIPLAFIFMFIWPLIGTGLAWFGNNSGKLPIGLDSLIFEIFERSLVPFGLHHVFYAPLWWTQAGGSMPELISEVMKNPKEYMNFINDINGLKVGNDKLSFIDNLNSDVSLGSLQILVGEWVSKLNPNTIAAVGDQTIMYKIISDPWTTFTQIQHLGLNLGRFQSGKFVFMMFGLPAAAVAMWLSVPKENRKKVLGIYLSAAFTCFLTGITEPIEFTFLFVAPWLFYGIHMPLCAISFMLMGLLHVHTSMTVSGGFIDFIVFGAIPFAAGKGTNFYHVLWIGAIYIPIYFFAFFFAIKYGKISLPGREGMLDKLYVKADFKAKKDFKTQNETVSKSISNEELKKEKVIKIIEFLGGEANIKGIDSCASRLRITVFDNTLVNSEGIKSLGGCNGVVIYGESIQCIYGGEQEVIKPYMQELLKKMRKDKSKIVTK